MKKLLIVFCCAFLVVILASAQQKKSKGVYESAVKCEIEGLLDKNLPITMVYVSKIVGHSLVCVDSAKIEKGKFHLFTDFDVLPSVRYVTIGKGEKATCKMVFLDCDKITLIQKNSDKAISVIGSVSNEEYCKMERDISKYNFQIDSLYKQYKNISLLTSKRKLAANEMDSLDEIINKIQVKYLEENNSEFLGLYLLAQNCYNLEGTRVEMLLKNVPISFKETSYYKNVERYLENDKKCIVGDSYKDFQMTTPEGKMVKLSDYAEQSKYLIVDFWASWCGPCRMEMPNMVRIYNEFKNRNIDIISVSLDKDAVSWKKGIKDLGMTWTQVSDLKYWDNTAAKLYGVQSIPFVMVIAPNGRIIAKNLRGEKLYQTIGRWAEKM